MIVTHPKMVDEIELLDASLVSPSLALNQTYSIDAKLSSFGSQSLVPSSVSDVSEEISAALTPHCYSDIGYSRPLPFFHLPDDNQGQVRYELVTLKMNSEDLFSRLDQLRDRT